MPINSTHPEYDRHIKAITKTRHAFDGEVVDYVPKKESQTVKQYEAFRTRPSYYNVVERTTSALVGALTRKPSTVLDTKGVEPDCDGNDSIDEFIQQSYKELLTTGRLGIYVDFDEDDQAPYLVQYASDNIVNWSPSFIVLQEHYYAQDPKDMYKTVQMCRYRELFIDSDGLFAVRIWEQSGKQYVVSETVQPTQRGKRLDYIPFVVVNPYDTTWTMCKPPLATLANINIEHFVLSAGLSHVAWVLSMPTPVLVGDLQSDSDNPQRTIALGGDQFIHLQTGGTATFMEYQGAGTEFLMNMQKAKEEQMFSLGSRLLQYKAGVESSDALQIRLGAEGASLTTLANALQGGILKAMEFYALWMSEDPSNVQVKLNKDFTPAQIAPDTIRILLEAYAKGVITLDTLMKRLYEGEIVDDANAEILALAADPLAPVVPNPTTAP